MLLMDQFQKEEVNLARINEAMVCLIPKVARPKKVREFRPLINCVFKIITRRAAL